MNAQPARAYVALGSNLGDRAAHLTGALDALRATPAIEVAAVSSLYETRPVGGPPQGAFLNAVVELRTALSPEGLLARLHEIEAAAGRERGLRNAPRILDLDLLLYDDLRLEAAGLVVPHPRLHERAFVLEPLAELAPKLRHPVLGERVAVLAHRARDPDGVRRLGDARASAWPAAPGPTA